MGPNRESCLAKFLAQKIGLTRKGRLSRALTIFVPSKFNPFRAEYRSSLGKKSINMFLGLKTKEISYFDVFLWKKIVLGQNWGVGHMVLPAV